MENTIRKQRGLTLIGFIIVLIMVLFFAYSAMRVVPMYLEYHALVNAMDKLQDDPLARNMTPNNIRISKKDGGVLVRVSYEVRKEFLGNIDLIGSFDRSVLLR